MATLITENFDSGTNGATMTTSTTGFTSFNGTPTFAAAQFITGALSGHFVGVASACAAYKDFTAAAKVYDSTYWYFAAIPSAIVYLKRSYIVTGGVVERTSVRINADGTVSMRNGVTLIWTSSLSLSAGQWYRFDWTVDSTGSIQRLKVYTGGGLHSTGTPYIDSGDQTYTQGTSERIATGMTASGTYDMYADSVRIDNASMPAAPISVPNIPPNVAMPANQVGAVSSGVTLAATTSDSDGTIASHLWTFDYKPPTSAASLSGASTATASFTPDVVGLYRLKLVVTDEDGDSTTGYTKVFVRASTVRPIAVTSNAGGWTNVGGAADIAAAVADASDATLAQSPGGTGTFEVRFRLAPLTPPTTATLNVRGLLTSASAATKKVALYEGATKRKEWTVSPSTTAATDALTMTSGEVATVTSWDEIDIALTISS